MKIHSARAIEILDSRGNPTVKARVLLTDGTKGGASVPSGASTGAYEARELRDGDTTRFGGKGVLSVVKNINSEISKAIAGLNAEDQSLIDKTLIELDGTENKSRLGANAMLAVSLAAARAAASSTKQPLYKYLNKITGAEIKMPIPFMNVINGGVHANWVTDIQEYMITPAGLNNFSESVRVCSEIYAKLKNVLKAENYSVNVGDEGGFAPQVLDNNEPFFLITEAIHQAGYVLGKDINFAIDVAASEFYQAGKYRLKREEKELSAEELTEFYKRLVKEHSVISIEDPFMEDDWESFTAITRQLGNKIRIVGDDLYATNPARIEQGINQKATNAVLIKPNQIGTLSETLQAISLAREGSQFVIISHRSGETEDSFIADLAVAVGAEAIKAGAPARGERTAKYNRLLEIESELSL